MIFTLSPHYILLNPIKPLICGLDTRYVPILCLLYPYYIRLYIPSASL